MLDATPLLRAYARVRLRRLERLNPAQAQERELLRLVAKAANTRFGRDHGFGAIRSVVDYQARVPLRRYEQFWDEYWKPAFPTITDVTWPGTVPYFALTSGTSSGRTKYIPVTAEMNRSNRDAVLDVLSFHIRNRPRSRVLGGKNFMLGGSTDLQEEAPGVLSGDLSGIAAIEVPWWARPRYFPPPELALLSDWERKVEALARRSLEEDIRTISGTPSWVLLFFDKVAAARGVADPRLAEFWPNLELLIHGGVSFAPYRRRFEQLLEGSHAELREVYPASEGFIAAADRGYGEGLRLSLDNGLFFEFVPLAELDAPAPTRHWAGTIETGVDYAIALTTCAGLWSYVLGDVVRFVERDPPRLLVTGRTSYFLSAFGEHLTGEEIDRAVEAGAQEIGAGVVDYSVGALFPERQGEAGGHLLIVEFAQPVGEAERLAAFERAVERTLRLQNKEYDDYRAAIGRLNPPTVKPVPPGFFAAWMKSRGKLGGQNKVPRIVTDPDLFASLCAMLP